MASVGKFAVDSTSAQVDSSSSSSSGDGFFRAARGEAIDATGDQEIRGFDANRMRARTYLTAAEEKKLIRRIDWHLMPLCSIMFLFKNLDVDNVSNARIMNRGTPQNILTQLNITSDEFALVTVLYYIPYIVFEAPSNLLLKRFSPSRWLSRIMLTWGIVLALHVPVSNKEGLYAARFFLGLAEAGMFPGVILLMTYWYRPDEMSLRLLYFYICGNLSGIFSGLLAYGFDTVSGAGGLSGWQWLFLVEAIATIIVSFGIWFLLPDFPETASWLTEKERAFIQARLPENAPRASEENFNMSEIWASLKDKRLWLFTLIWALFTVGTSGVRFYQPTVIANLGFTTIAQAQLLNLPISVFGLFVIFVTGYFADNGRLPRPLYPLSFLLIILASYAVLIVYPNNGGVYAATLIGNAVTAAWYPMMWPWRVQTTSRATGSAFSIGFVNSYGQIGGAIGPQIFRSAYAPKYTVSFGVAAGLVGACAIITVITWWVTRQTERDTRKLKRARIAASKRDEAILNDVVDNDLKRASY
ncbi:major facilitator superfamily domain-containing protein [Xylaria bambusicola]|uniref:major facilitator superfamily domain-containing protein n=1 Tax=Xylaria bambusicola TaxID=326684 RepID=UPI002007C5DD|nr:major facilitator superfamily domain-containing protein [Xylaria bambusicola]KAI0521387.1 major facilitator superfamily domain-containing protein [Xylaria bambusicola]